MPIVTIGFVKKEVLSFLFIVNIKKEKEQKHFTHKY